jgi:hypothetical protein
MERRFLRLRQDVEAFRSNLNEDVAQMGRLLDTRWKEIDRNIQDLQAKLSR